MRDYGVVDERADDMFLDDVGVDIDMDMGDLQEQVDLEYNGGIPPYEENK